MLDDLAQVRADGDPDARERLGGAGVLRTPPVARPRTLASGPSTARMTSATAIAVAGFASRKPPSAPRWERTMPGVAQLAEDVLQEVERDLLAVAIRSALTGFSPSAAASSTTARTA